MWRVGGWPDPLNLTHPCCVSGKTQTSFVPTGISSPSEMRSNLASLLNFMNSPTGPPCAVRKASTPSSLVGGSRVIGLGLLAPLGVARFTSARKRRSRTNDDDVFRGARENTLHFGKPEQRLFWNLATAHERKVSLLH